MLAYAAVWMFVALAGASNVAFALTLSPELPTRGFWVAIAVASALYTTRALPVLAQQLKTRAWGRSLAAFVLAVATLGYDVIAAYGLSQAEHSRMDYTANKDAGRVAAVRRDLKAAEDGLSARAATPPTVEAKGKLAACRKQCDGARTLVAEAEGRDELRNRVDQLRKDLAGLEAPSAGDTRSNLLGHELTVWLPVLLVTLGSLLGGFSVEPSKPSSEPPAPSPQAAAEPPKPNTQAAVEPPTAHPIVPKLRSVAEAPPAGVEVHKGWIKGSQRKLAAAIGTPPSRLNRDLRDAAAAGAIELRTDDGTAVRLN